MPQVENELFSLARAFESNDELREALTDQSLPAARRQAIVENLLGGKASPITVSLVSFIVVAGRARDLPAIIDRVVERAAAERKHAVADGRSAVPLDARRRQKLAKALRAISSSSATRRGLSRSLPRASPTKRRK